jgi:hypothetical protein
MTSFTAKCTTHGSPLRLLRPYSGFSEEKFQQFVKLVRAEYPRWI